jgi:acyl transferase domain-containing protein
MTLETGCSSSLVALNQACHALKMGDCCSAIVAGTNLIFSPTIGMHGAALSVFSPSGTSKTFDASADGYGRGEAVNAVLIKRLDDAVRDGDPIRAVIRSTMVNCDGRSLGITTPSTDAQEKLIRGAYQKAFINDISQTAFVECHGTGTLAGDPIECAAIASIFPKGVYIGSACLSVCRTIPIC